jgi:hypothetical protein
MLENKRNSNETAQRISTITNQTYSDKQQGESALLSPTTHASPCC